MFLTILGVIFFIALLFVPREIELENDRGDTKTISLRALRIGITIGGAFALFIGLFMASYRSVPAGYRGVLLQFGAVRSVLPEGANFIVPFAQDMDLMEVRTQKADAQAAAASKDLQTVNTEVAINYHVDPRAVGILYKSVGPDFENRIIHPAVQETLKATVAQFTAEELIRLRDQVKAQVDTGITARLLPYHIVVEPQGISLTNFNFSDQFNQAIESKQVAQQTAEQQKYVLAKAQMEAQTAITQAKGVAEANRIKANALNTQGGQKVLAQAWIDRWDGHLPTVSGTGSSTLISLDSLLQEKK